MRTFLDVLDADGIPVESFATEQALSFVVDEPSAWALFAFGIFSLAIGRFYGTNGPRQRQGLITD
jgi:hypothetical protein